MRWFVACLIFLFPTFAAAQPFGIVMGQKVETLQAEKTERDFIYKVKPPKSHPEMDFYLVTATPTQGVCLVKGVGVDHSNDSFGFKVKETADSISKQISATYGSVFYLNDFLERGSIWQDPKYWTMAIRKNERYYQYVWRKSKKSALASDVSEILETVSATSSETTYLTVQFTFNNHAACKAEMDSTVAKAF